MNDALSADQKVVLRHEIAELRRRLDKIENEENLAEAIKLTGKCFRYRNCYSCPQGEDDYWWLYMRVIGTDSDGLLETFTFQKDKNGRVTIETDRPRPAMMSGGYEPITLKQFQAAWKEVSRTITNRAKLARAST